jgi:hypothetical protein
MHTKDSINRRDTGIKTLVTSFNRQVDTMKHLQASIPRYRLLPIPAKLDVKKIFRIDVFSTLWEDGGLLSNDDEERWRTDDRIRIGIQHLLELDRCKEENERLKWEVFQLAKWAMERADALTGVLPRIGAHFLSRTLARSIAEISFITDHQDEVKLHLFYEYVSNFRLLLERLEASLKGFTFSPSFSQSLQVLKPIPFLPRYVVGSSSAIGTQEAFGAKEDESSDEATDTGSDVTEIEGLLEMDWESD